MKWLFQHWVATTLGPSTWVVFALAAALLALGGALAATTFAGLVEALSALLGMQLALRHVRSMTRAAVEYWTQRPLALGASFPALVSAGLLSVVGLALLLLELTTGRLFGEPTRIWLGPLGFGLMFYFATVLLAERVPNGSLATTEQTPAHRRAALSGLIGVLVLIVRAFSVPAASSRLDVPGLVALVVAGVAALAWKRGRRSFGTDCLPD